MGTARKLQEKEKTIAHTANEDDSRNSIEQLSNRQSRELIIGLCGTVGSGLKSIAKIAANELEDLGYEVFHIRISDLMQSLFSEWQNNIKTPYERYSSLQNFGDELRQKYYPHILAEAVIHAIKIEKTAGKFIETNKKVAFLVDQLKHPDEIELLRMVYQHNFYLLGIIRNETEIKRNLRDEGLTKPEVDEIIHHDRKSTKKFGQQTSKAILDADYFIKNDQGQREHLKIKLKRFFNLIHGINGLTPTSHEKGMYAAHSASLLSACLSRQVGAAILDTNGNLISVGRNDVPKYNGGLYSSDDGINDHRCIHKGGKCYNDVRKLKIKEKLSRLLLSDEIKNLDINITEKNANIIADILYEKTPISSIIEYSRSIHAEMDAITTLARLGNGGGANKLLYTTTFPCHNCARHIIAVGITKVIYIEPYDKSLALELHDDAITEINESGKVIFESFEGVSPKRYMKFFLSTNERKNNYGQAEKTTTKYKNHIDIQFLDSYVSFEDRVADVFIKSTEKK